MGTFLQKTLATSNLQSLLILITVNFVPTIVLSDKPDLEQKQLDKQQILTGNSIQYNYSGQELLGILHLKACGMVMFIEFTEVRGFC